MFRLNKIPKLHMGTSGLDAGLSEEELAIQEVAHRFAEDVMRPIGKALDKLTPEEVIAPNSPLFEYLAKIQETGILDLETLEHMDNEQKSRLIPLIFEELGWGDSGLAILSLATAFPAFIAHSSGDPELIEQFGSRIGCWLATQPDRGSETVDFQGHQIATGAKQHKGNIAAHFDGDDLIINGQSSAWVTGGPIAQTALAYISCDYGDGIVNENGTINQIALLIDLEQDGVTKGKPLDKIGQRPLPQGEVFFDNVRVPKKNIISQGKDFSTDLYGALTFANMEMACTFTGVARAAFDHSLAYCHERIQGGVPIIEHQSVQIRLFDLWQKVEASRALARRVANFNYLAPEPNLTASITAKTFATRTAFEASAEAIQLFGGNGLTKEYPVEKLMRDAKASMIEDGENNILALKAVSYLSEWYKETNDL
jgi:acyl-CoA dehydrogenase